MSAHSEQDPADRGWCRPIGLVMRIQICVALALIGVAAFQFSVHRESDHRLLRALMVGRARHLAETAARLCAEPLRADDVGALRRLADSFRAGDDILTAAIYDAEHRRLCSGRPAVHGGPTIDRSGADPTIAALGRATASWASADRVVAVAPARIGEDRVGSVKIELSYAPALAASAGIQRRASLALGGFLLGAVLLAAVAARLIMHPVRRLLGVARSVAMGDFDARAAVDRSDELGELAESFNGMLDALTLNDVHREKLERTNSELRTSRASAEATAKAKAEFLSSMSHEIRTPLTAILGFTELLREDAPDRATRKVVDTIHENGHHLLALLDDILDLSRLEADRMSTEREPCDVQRIAQGVVELLRARAEARGVELRLETTTAVPAWIASDARRVRQILLNLVGNAVKFTEHGHVVVRLSEEGSDDDDRRIAIEVEDTGIGMSGEQLSRVFAPFAQADATTTRRFGGTGLGLALSHRFAIALGGSIDVASETDVGSRFTLRIPSVACEPPVDLSPGGDATPAAGDAPLRGARVLIAEDGPDNRCLIEAIIRRAGGDLCYTENGNLAVAAALAAEADGRPFDLVLMDVQMPELDGCEATRALRNAGYRRPIVALTAHALADEMQRCLDAGCDAYETKPIRRRRLLDTLAGLLTDAAPSPPPTAQPRR
ncbi:MAG: response regulator [Planctomycetes bacterium]|nr:response regulator [Planctomycetota bacterium]